MNVFARTAPFVQIVGTRAGTQSQNHPLSPPHLAIAATGPQSGKGWKPLVGNLVFPDVLGYHFYRWLLLVKRAEIQMF